MYLSSVEPLSLHINMTYKPYHNLLISHNTLCICNQGVTGSIPVGGTIYFKGLADFSAPISRAGLHMGYKNLK